MTSASPIEWSRGDRCLCGTRHRTHDKHLRCAANRLAHSEQKDVGKVITNGSNKRRKLVTITIKKGACIRSKRLSKQLEINPASARLILSHLYKKGELRVFQRNRGTIVYQASKDVMVQSWAKIIPENGGPPLCDDDWSCYCHVSGKRILRSFAGFRRALDSCRITGPGVHVIKRVWQLRNELEE